MKIYLVKLGLSSPMSQPEVIDALQNAGYQTIQTSAGVCFKCELEFSDLKKLHEKLAAVPIEVINPNEKCEVDKLSPDIKNFIGS